MSPGNPRWGLTICTVSERWPLTGRDDELHQVVEDLLGDTHRGVLIAGKAGVGKTRLGREAASAMAAHGWAVRRVAGTPAARSILFAPFMRWAAEPAASRTAQVVEIVAALTRDAGEAPLLVVADDVQWLDEMSALVLHHLVVQELANVILTLRSGEPASDTVIAMWKDDHLDRLDLQPLTRPESDALVQRALTGRVPRDFLDRLWRLTQGNALFLRHLVEQEQTSTRLALDGDTWHWVSGPVATPSLVDLVKLQIGNVPAALREAVDLVAVAEPIDWSCLSTLVAADVVEAAAERGLLDISSDGAIVRAGHPLYTEVRWEECGPVRLRQLRSSVVKALLSQRPTTPVDPLRLGMLWLDSDLDPDSDVFVAAAQTACARLDLVAAERLARAALAATRTDDIAMLLAYVLYLKGDGPEVERILATIDTRRLPTGFINAVTLRAANRLWVLREPARSRDIVEEALEESDGDLSHSLRTFHAFQQAIAGYPEDARRDLDDADLSRLDPFGQVMGRCAETLAAGDAGRVQHACASAAAGYAVIEAAPQDSIHELGLAEQHANALLVAGDVEAAATAANLHFVRCADTPGLTRAMAVAMLGTTALGSGDLAGALEHFDAAATEAENDDINGTFYRFRVTHTEALARSGRIGPAAVALDLTTARRHAAYDYVEPAFQVATAWVAATRGTVDEARRICGRAAELARSRGQWSREVLCLQTAVQFGFTGAAQRLVDLAGVVEGPRAQVAARHAEALAATDGAALDASSLAYERMGDRLAAADAAAQAAAAHRLSGRRGSALTSNSRAQQLARHCGGADSPALRGARIALPLTPREHEIVLLVAAGMSNREIADATSLSIRTVEGHVFRATVKAGVSGRSELSALISADLDVSSIKPAAR